MIKPTLTLTIFKEVIYSKVIRFFLPVVFWLLISLAAISLFSRVTFVGLAQVCQSPAFDSLGRFSLMTRDTNGFLHVTVNLSGGPDAPPNADTVTAMQAAVNEWNSYQATTKVIIETAPAGTPSTVEFVYRPTVSSDTGGCARFDPPTKRIYYGPELQARLANLGLAEVAVVFKHELGHFLGLGHTTTTQTIMNADPYADTNSLLRES